MSKDLTGLYNIEPTNLKIYDSEYLDGSKQYDDIGKELEKILSKYIKILNSLSSALEGNFAKNIKAFSENVENLLSDSIDGSTSSLKSNMKTYITSIDSCDSNLY